MVRVIEKKYKEVQETEVVILSRKYKKVIQKYREILELIEKHPEPLPERLQKIQIHAFRGLGLTYLHMNKVLLGNYYLNYAKTLHRLTSV